MAVAGDVPDKGLRRSAFRLARGALVALTAGMLVVLAVHFLAWLNAAVVASDDGTYAPFVELPIAIASGVGMAAAAIATVLLHVLPRRSVVAAGLVGAAAILGAVVLGIGFDVSNARSDPYAALTTTIERLQFPASLSAGPLTHTTVDIDVPALQRSWHGNAPSFDCAGVRAAIASAYPGAAVYAGGALTCSFNVYWQGTTISVDESGGGSSTPASVDVAASLTS